MAATQRKKRGGSRKEGKTSQMQARDATYNPIRSKAGSQHHNRSRTPRNAAR